MTILELLAVLEGAEVKLNIRYKDCEMEVHMDKNLTPGWCDATKWNGGLGHHIETVRDAPSAETACDEFLKACGINLK